MNDIKSITNFSILIEYFVVRCKVIVLRVYGSDRLNQTLGSVMCSVLMTILQFISSGMYRLPPAFKRDQQCVSAVNGNKLTLLIVP